MCEIRWRLKTTANKQSKMKRKNDSSSTHRTKRRKDAVSKDITQSLNYMQSVIHNEQALRLALQVQEAKYPKQQVLHQHTIEEQVVNCTSGTDDVGGFDDYRSEPDQQFTTAGMSSVHDLPPPIPTCSSSPPSEPPDAKHEHANCNCCHHGIPLEHSNEDQMQIFQAHAIMDILDIPDTKIYTNSETTLFDAITGE